MDSKCTVIITRGKNKGKICGDINTRCKHTSEVMVCAICGAEFARSTSYYRHVKKHSDNSAPPPSKPKNTKIKLDIKPKIQANIKVKSDFDSKAKYNFKAQAKAHVNSNSNSKTKPEPEPEPPINLNFSLQLKSPETKPVPNHLNDDILQRLNDIERQNCKLKTEVEELKERPPITNYNIAVIGSSEDLYTELLSLMGGDHQNAMEFLTESCSNENSISVFKRLYLDGKSPEDYPVACRDPLHFRYLDPERQIVDDTDGNIGKLVSNQLINTYLMAANNTMARDMLSARDLLLLQEKAASISCKSIDLTEQLALLTKNPNHPFFK